MAANAKVMQKALIHFASFLKMQSYMLLISLLSTAIIHADVLTLNCIDDGYSLNSDGQCVFLDKSTCTPCSYATLDCTSTTELQLIAKWYSKQPSTPLSLLDILKIHPNKPWLNILEQPALTGFGRARFYRYAYYANDDVCKKFVWGGMDMGANDNRFIFKLECEQMRMVYRKYLKELSTDAV